MLVAGERLDGLDVREGHLRNSGAVDEGDFVGGDQEGVGRVHLVLGPIARAQAERLEGVAALQLPELFSVHRFVLRGSILPRGHRGSAGNLGECGGASDRGRAGVDF